MNYSRYNTVLTSLLVGVYECLWLAQASGRNDVEVLQAGADVAVLDTAGVVLGLHTPFWQVCTLRQLILFTWSVPD